MNWISNAFKKMGAFINSTIDNNDEVSTQDELDLINLKVIDLRTYAKGRGLTGYTGLKKAELIEFIKNN
jgi:hypothetical protein